MTIVQLQREMLPAKMMNMDLVEKIRTNPKIWEVFTKEEEYNASLLDRHGRFLYYSSEHRKLMEPAVSRYLIEHGFAPEYPDGKKFAVCLTHDIDKLKQGVKSCLFVSAMSAIRGDLKKAIKYPLYNISKKKHPFWNFQKIMKLEEKYGAKSSFYFLALKPGEKDFNYNLEEVADEIRYISDRGWEVGLHGGHESYNNIEDLMQKKKMLENILGKEVIGYRNHYLRFKTPDTWELLSKAGFKYDTTFGYADCVGFRNGMCHPFKPFNLATDKLIDIVEIPLVIMDVTLFENYMRLDFEKAWEITQKLIDTAEQCRGVITILWHNEYMQGDYLRFYEMLLKYAFEKNAWMTSGENILKDMSPDV